MIRRSWVIRWAVLVAGCAVEAGAQLPAGWADDDAVSLELGLLSLFRTGS